jgi:hypothetical protein
LNFDTRGPTCGQIAWAPEDELKRKHDAALARAEAAEAKLTDAPWEEIAYIANAIDDHPAYEQACAVIHAWLAANAPQGTGE